MTDRIAIEFVLEHSAFATLFTTEIAARTGIEQTAVEQVVERLADEGRVVVRRRTVEDHGAALLLGSVTIVGRGAARIHSDASEQLSAWELNEAHWKSFNRDFIAHRRCC